MFFDKRPDVWSNRRAVEPHHEQLALCDAPSASPLAAIGEK